MYLSDLSSMKTKLKTEVKSEVTAEPSSDTIKKSPSSDKSDGPGDAEVKVKTEPGAATTQTPKEAKDAGKKTASAVAGEQRRLGISEAVRAEMERVVTENRRIQDLATTVHQKNHEIMLKVHICSHLFRECLKEASKKFYICLLRSHTNLFQHKHLSILPIE